MQYDNGDKKGSEVGQSDAEDLQDGPVVDNDARVIVADDTMVPNEEEIVLRDGAGSSSPGHKKTRTTTSARQDVEDRSSGTTRVSDNDDNMDDDGNSKRQRLNHVNQFDDMYAYLSGIPVVHDDVPQQMFSCVANGKY